MNTRTGLEIVAAGIPAVLQHKRIGLLCHAPSITADFDHAIDLFAHSGECRLAAIFGPQHGVFGQTQDNMIEWSGFRHPWYQVPVYSLYGEHRKPTPEMLADIDVLVVDVQDVGTRVYTYAWTVRLCMEACQEAGIPMVVLDRPNPIAPLGFDGAVLKREFFTFVGMAEIPLCHGMTIGELAKFIQRHEVQKVDLTVIPMENWHHGMTYAETGLPWVIPSPNMPTERTATVYPGAVLIEALNLSEARGTTTPFELFGAPYVDARALKAALDSRRPAGCKFRVHNYIPTFHKFARQDCEGLQIHVTDLKRFRPVRAFMEIFAAVMETAKTPDALQFIPPPYEYEFTLTPFDILSGDANSRLVLQNHGDLAAEFARWDAELAQFAERFEECRLYPDCFLD